MNIFLLIGQSNMAGRGHIDKVPSLKHPKVFMFRQGNWIPAEEPLHTDRPNAGIGLGMSFAVKLVDRERCESVGLIPCAFGGTSLSAWMANTELYNNAVTVTRQALSHGRLSGILWHQGENDSMNYQDAASYGERFQQMVHNLRQSLEAQSVPVIAGELGMFLNQTRSYAVGVVTD